MSVLVVVAHSDDESLWAGGTIAKHVKAGVRVRVLALSDGVASRPGTDSYQRWLAFGRAMKALGVTDWGENEVFPDQQSDTVPQLRINKAVEAEIADWQPSVVYTHHVGDLNLDHRRVAEAVLVATRPGSSSVERVLCMTPEWPTRCVGPAWAPDVHEAIADTLEQKLAACRCYTDELRPWPHPRSERAISAQTHESFMEIR